MKFCSRAEACSPFFSLIMLRCGGLKWSWVRDSLAYAPGVSVFPFFPVLSPGGCEFMWVAALTVVLPCAVSLSVAGSFTVFTVGCCYTVGWVFLFTVCSWFFHYIVGVHCKALVLLIGVILRIAIHLQ
jgi:hypothetical protein